MFGEVLAEPETCENELRMFLAQARGDTARCRPRRSAHPAAARGCGGMLRSRARGSSPRRCGRHRSRRGPSGARPQRSRSSCLRRAGSNARVNAPGTTRPAGTHAVPASRGVRGGHDRSRPRRCAGAAARCVTSGVRGPRPYARRHRHRSACGIRSRPECRSRRAVRTADHPERSFGSRIDRIRGAACRTVASARGRGKPESQPRVLRQRRHRGPAVRGSGAAGGSVDTPGWNGRTSSISCPSSAMPVTRPCTVRETPLTSGG